MSAEELATGRQRVVVESDIQALIPAFLDDLQRFAADLTLAVQRADFATLKGIGHQLKGVGTPYGFPYISALGTAIEKAAAVEALPELARLASASADYLARLEIVYV